MSSFLNAPHQNHRLWNLITREQSHVAHLCELLGLGAVLQENTRGLIEIMEGGGWLPEHLLSMHRQWAELHLSETTKSSPYLQVIQDFA